ncbi:MAG: DUF308 domain-containing protein [Lachnospiraceae bacterium]|nr:DUF308 domain-containing protein [Lachnospiraceae bacterium]
MSNVKKLRIARIGYILMSLVFYIAGLAYMAAPDISPSRLCIVGGIILIIYGVIRMIGYFSDDLYCLAFQHDLGCGLFLVILGVIVLAANKRIQGYLSIGFGGLILLDSLLTIQTCGEAKKFGIESWMVLLILSLIAGTCGVLVIAGPFQSVRSLHILAGCALFAEGLMKQFAVHITVAKQRDAYSPDESNSI